MNNNGIEQALEDPSTVILFGSRVLELENVEPVAPENTTTLFQYRSIDGTGNNLYYPTVGSAHTQLLRLLAPAYENGISEPRGGAIVVNPPGSDYSYSIPKPYDPEDPDSVALPSPRDISNAVAAQTESIPNFLGASDWLWQWGQFIDHDLDLNEGGHEAFFIPVSETDSLFNPHFPYLPFTRVPAADGTGSDSPRQQDNAITSYIDGSGVYGSDTERAHFLRTFANGRLETTIGDNGEHLLPYNGVKEVIKVKNEKGEYEYVDVYFENANAFGADEDTLYLAGDVRANEQMGLTANHVLFVREHNRLTAEILERLEAGEAALVAQYQSFKEGYLSQNPDVLDEAVVKDEYLYQAARKVVSAQIQVITYKEFLPILIGETLLEDYVDYNPYINPAVSNEFANAAYRLGHTLLNNQIKRFDDSGLESIALKEAFFNPKEISENGIDSLLRGLMLQEAQELDNFIVDGVRNFLFPAGTGGFDLASVNIQRGREVGLPSYVDTYEQLFGIKITSFKDLPFASDVIDLFKEAYDDVGQIDLWLGGISESSASHGGLLGPTFSFFIKDQFARAAAGDRFFFLNDLKELTVLDEDLTDTNLSTIIRRNTSQGYLVQDNAFQVPYDNTILGDDRSNSLRGTRKNDLIDGQGGNDFIRGRQGDDILIGDLGNDYIVGGAGADTVMGGDGHDILTGNAGQDVLVGGNGNDMLQGGGGNDILNGVGSQFGQYDFDILKGGGGQDTFILGDERSIFYQGRGMAMIQHYNRHQDTIQLAGSASDYKLMTFGSYTSIRLAENDDLIAILNGTVRNFDTGFKFT
ncbi:peroxidase family protein [Acaryochloris sp. IP29b_bin.148]|uniref:peroxidase family protein n=1 Tax=Acaryochloris sp. IP29b_bin.148 TaxID=2969218 RepID=UPI002620742E|nr:peroxidase family protein [Acaryochloris sp. IP29b_bin.148]